MKKFVALLLAVMMMVAGMTAASAMTAGTYSASAKGFGGDVTVTVGNADMTFAKKDTALVRLRVEF